MPDLEELPEIESCADLPEPTVQQWIDREEDYRRGFTHGLAYACELLESFKKKGFTRPQECANIIEHFNLEICYPWRYRVEKDVASGNEELLHDHPKLRQEPWWNIRQRILTRDGFTCKNCGAAVTSKTAQIDHIFPVVSGGLPFDDNLQTLCRPCNAEKGASC